MSAHVLHGVFSLKKLMYNKKNSKGPFTRHSFWVRHAQILARGPTLFRSPDAFTRQNI